MAQNFRILVKTGDRLFAGTDANVTLKLHGKDGEKSDDLDLDNLFINDFEQGSEDVFKLKNVNFEGDVEFIEFWRDDSGIAPAWQLERIEITCTDTDKTYVFPVFRWIKANRHYFISHLDTSLPQDETFVDLRKLELEEKRSLYELTYHKNGLPVQVGTFLLCVSRFLQKK